MKHPDHESVARAIETLTDSVQDDPSLQRTLMALRPNDREASQASFSEFDNSLQQSNFQLVQRPPTAMGNFQIGTPRPTSTAPYGRRNQGPWNQQPSNRPQASTGSLFSMPSSSSFGRVSGRKPYAATPSRFSPSAAEFYPWNQPSAGESNSMRTTSGNFGQGKDYYPCTPTAPSRGRYGRAQEPPSAGSSFDSNNQMSTAIVSRNSLVGPLIHLNERSVAIWHSDIMEFYAVIRAFVERHASQPDHASSMKMSSTPLWPILLATYHPLSDSEAASYLEYHLRNENSKACLVTRVVIDYIVNRVWTPAAWTGADDESTFALINLERDMERLHGKLNYSLKRFLNFILLVTQLTPYRNQKVNPLHSASLSSIDKPPSSTQSSPKSQQHQATAHALHNSTSKRLNKLPQPS